MKFEIKHRLNGKVLFSLETQSLKLCVEAAVKSGAYLRDANLRNAYLRDADLRNAYLGGADLRDADLGGADLMGADLRNAYLGGSYLRDAYLRDAYLGGADLRNADLGGADLMGAYLMGANLMGADLRDADLGGANLRNADLEGADLMGAYLMGAYLMGADLGGADLRDAYLRDADLRNAYLRDAKNISKYWTTNLYSMQDQIGKIRAYKLVNKKGEGPYNGGIKYEIGKTVSVKDADCDESVQCSRGISLADLPWCLKEWRKGYKILIAEFTAKDIAAIPIGSDGKFRVHKCKIVGEKDLKELGLIT